MNFCIIFSRTSRNWCKRIEKRVITGNCPQFPEIPTKISENFTEKSTISVDLQQHFEKIKSAKISKSQVRKSENFEM